MPENPKQAATVWKAEAKFLMANERTMIAWLRIAATIGVGALVGAMASNSKSVIHTSFHGAQVVIATLISAYALAMYRRRVAQVRARHMGTFDEPFAPAIVALILATGIGMHLTYLVRQPTVGCLELPLPMWRNATPPYLYVSFHGASNLRHSRTESMF